MYIAIFEDGEMKLLDSIGEGDLEACAEGVLDLIDVSVADKPTRYWDGKWNLIGRD
jgi:hypothetical protein